MMKNNRLKEQKGFAASDALIAVLIIALFSGIIANISYNIFLANTSVKRMSEANSYIIDVFEYVDKQYYYDVNKDSLISYFNDKYYYESGTNTPKENARVKALEEEGEERVSPFLIELSVENYNEKDGNQGKIDLLKEITIKVQYKVGNKNQTIEMKRIKQRENLKVPNEPDLSLVELQGGGKLYPLKRLNGQWTVCDSKDNAWYSYENGNWAIVLETQKNLSIGENVDVNSLITDVEYLYIWIPRYAYNSAEKKIEFLFKGTNKRVVKDVNQYYKLEDINSQYIIPSEINDGAQGIWTNNIYATAYIYLDEVYQINTLGCW